MIKKLRELQSWTSVLKFIEEKTFLEKAFMKKLRN